jgi:uncharacterized repeat protein (TIGR02543 family)
LGWFAAASGGSALSSPYTLSGSLTLYAQWSTNATDTVAFNAEGGSTVASLSGPDGSSITLPGAPTYPGHTFLGWFAAASGGSALSSPYTLSGSLTLYAQWSTNATDTLSYNLVGSDGGVFSFGSSTFHGSIGGLKLNRPIVAMALTPNLGGYWLVGSDGGIFTFGDAHYFGSTGAKKLNEPIVGMAATPDGGGYWLVASDGGVFAFGDAVFYGSTGAKKLNEPIVGMAATPDGDGYWLVASDGGVFAFGDAAFLGSTGGIHLNNPIVGVAAS